MEFKLIKEEIVRQVHHTIKDLCPECEIDGAAVDDFMIDKNGDDSTLVFEAARFADRFNLDSSRLIDDLYRELGIEYEKNLHDRFLFSLLRNDKAIYFEQVSRVDK